MHAKICTDPCGQAFASQQQSKAAHAALPRIIIAASYTSTNKKPKKKPKSEDIHNPTTPIELSMRSIED